MRAVDLALARPGRVVHRWVLDSGLLRVLDHDFVTERFCFGEEHVGTNGMGSPGSRTAIWSTVPADVEVTLSFLRAPPATLTTELTLGLPRDDGESYLDLDLRYCFSSWSIVRSARSVADGVLSRGGRAADTR